MNKPQYPVYIISKGRHDVCYTASRFVDDGVEFRLVVEPQEEHLYRELYGDRVLVTPFSNLGQGSIPARNFVWEHSIKRGAKRHWIYDDNIRHVRRWHKGKRIPCNANPAMRVIEDFTDRYENIGISGMVYTMFQIEKMPPYNLNCHVYSCLLIDNAMPFRWRGRYNEDTDLCLQVLSSGLCTVNFNVFGIEKMVTMTMKGGNMDELYKDDGRLVMARSLERVWPGVVQTKRLYGRPQHYVNWRKFDNELIRRKDIDWSKLTKDPNEYGMKIRVKKELKSDELRKLFLDDEEK